MGRAAAGCLPASLDLAIEVRILCAESGFDICESGGSGGGELGDSVECRVKKKEDRIA
jgi:hypothetical protein